MPQRLAGWLASGQRRSARESRLYGNRTGRLGRAVGSRLLSVVDRKGDGIKHVEPETLLPLTVLVEIEPEGWVLDSDGDRRLSLCCSTIPDEALPNRLGSISDYIDSPLSGSSLDCFRELVQFIEPCYGMPVGRLENDRSWIVSVEPGSDILESPRPPACFRYPFEGTRTCCDKTLSRKDREPKLPKPRINGEYWPSLFLHSV